MATAQRPFRFGVQAHGTSTAGEWRQLARRIEGSGYATMTMPDHFDDQLAPIPALQCAADATTELRLGALVYSNDYRHPIVLAKELATMDVLSDGRVQIGLGSGWMVSDYDQAGMTYDRPGMRVDRMFEALAIIRAAMAPEPFSFDGEHYTISDYDGLPKPIQSPPPVLIGGGQRRMLTFAAQHADIVGVNGTMPSGTVDQATFESLTPAAVDDKVALVHDVASTAGRADAIEMNVRSFMVSVTDDVDGTLATLSQFTGAPPAVIAESPFALVGPPAKLIEDLLERRERWGFSYVIVGQNEIEQFAPVVDALAGT